MTTTPLLETPRLLLRPLELADADQAQVLFPRWEIVKHLNAVVPWPYPPDGAGRALDLVDEIENRSGSADRQHQPDEG